MKRVFKILILCVLVALTLAVSASASEISSSDEIKTYVSERIIPVIAGALTSLIALLGTLKSVIKTLKELKGSRGELERVQKEIKEQSKAEYLKLQEKCEHIEESTKDVSAFKAEIKELCSLASGLQEQIARLSELACIGFLQNSELVRSGKAKEIAVLAEQNQVVSGVEEH